MKKGILCGFLLLLTFSVSLSILYFKYDSKQDSSISLLGKVSEDINEYNSAYKIFKTEGKNAITYNVVDYERNLAYSWTFNKEENKSDIPLNQTIEMDINLRLNIDAITNATNNINQIVDKDKLIVSFDYHGDLPTSAKIKIDVRNKFKNGDELYLYYYNPELNQIEYIDRNIEVKNGYVEFDIEHCSDYFLTASVVNEAVNNPKSINYIIIILGVIVFILIAVTLIQSKK